MRSHVARMQRQPPDLEPLQVHPIGVPAIGIARACLAAQDQNRRLVSE